MRIRVRETKTGKAVVTILVDDADMQALADEHDGPLIRQAFAIGTPSGQLLALSILAQRREQGGRV